MKKIEREYLATVKRYDGLLDMEAEGHRVQRVILMLDRKLAEYERKLGKRRVVRALRKYGLGKADIERVIYNMHKIGVFKSA